MSTSEADYKKFLKHMDRYNDQKRATVDALDTLLASLPPADQQDVTTEVLEYTPKKTTGFWKWLFPKVSP